MSKKQIEKTATGFNVLPDPQEVATKAKAKSANQSDRIEAKLDLLLSHNNITP